MAISVMHSNSGQMMNAGERLIVNNRSFGYLSHRIVFYMLNLHIKTRRTYFARVSDRSISRRGLPGRADNQW